MVEDGENEDDDGEEQRDRVKSRKFKQMMGQGLIPTAAAEAYAKCTNRKEQTALINSLFSMKGGRLQLQEQFRTPKNYKREYETTTSNKASDIQDGYGELIFKKKFNLSDDELQHGLRTGEIVTWTSSNNIQMYAAANQSFAQASLKAEKEQLSTDEQQISAAVGKAFVGVFNALSPQIEVNSGSSKRQKSITGQASAPSQRLVSLFMVFLWQLVHVVVNVYCWLNTIT